jgi:hypothetical protein
MLFHKEVLWCGWCTTEKKIGKFGFLVQMDAVENEEELLVLFVEALLQRSYDTYE